MNLKDIRIRKNISQKKLAEDLNYNQTLVSMWEHNTREPSNKALIQLADYFNVTIDELLGREEPQTNQMLLSNFTDTQLELINKVRTLTDSQCITLCNMLDTLTNQQTNLETYKKLKKYED